MMVGNPERFAIESCVSEAYTCSHFRALGYFVIHILGTRFGVARPDATYLACSSSEVAERIRDRGLHDASFAAVETGHKIATAFQKAFYAMDCDDTHLLGLPLRKFKSDFSASRHVWAPDGDTAFDDGSYVLHFDVGSQVRLIAFSWNEHGHINPEHVKDLCLGEEEFYSILEEWHFAFERELKHCPKIDIERDSFTRVS